MSNIIDKSKLKNLFSKPYGASPPDRKLWEEFYNKDVIFIDPTQKTQGLDSYIEAQERLINRCDDIYIETHAISLDESYGFVEWTMGLKIMGKEFVYPGTTRLLFSKDGLIQEHRDYFDFCGPTFGPVPILGPFIRWIYSKLSS